MDSIYIAGPFFNNKEKYVIEQIEEACKNANVDFFSPMREGGILKNMTPQERATASFNVYHSNVNAISESDAIIAVIDNFDPGTMFELGVAANAGIRIVTFTNEGHGLNVMIAHCAAAHTNNPEHAVNAAIGRTYAGFIPKVDT